MTLSRQPSLTDTLPLPHFGTDGWRAVIGDDFTEMSLRAVARATGRVFAADHPGGTILVGYDTRFRADEFARYAAEELAACGLNVKRSDRFLPTPALCYAVSRDEEAVGGVMLTASHNPASFLGFKVRMADGGASPVAFTERIEAELSRAADAQHFAAESAHAGTAQADFAAPALGSCSDVDFIGDYIDSLYACIDTEAVIAYAQAHPQVSLVVDALYGAGQGYLARALSELGFDVRAVHAEINPSFGGLHPEPIPPWTDAARACVLANGAAAAFVTDGDADRLGAIDEHGAFVSPHRIIALVAQHLVQDRGMHGRIVKTLSTSVGVDRLGRLLGCEVTTTPIGFKWIYEEMLKGDVLIGGEESGGIGLPGHVRERDGLLMALLLTEMMAQRDATLGELVAQLEAATGPLFYGRDDLRLTHEQVERFKEARPTLAPGELAGQPVRDSIRRDGAKFLMDDDAWLLLRASGTEPLIRVYAEASTPELKDALLLAGRKLVEEL